MSIECIFVQWCKSPLCLLGTQKGFPFRRPSGRLGNWLVRPETGLSFLKPSKSRSLFICPLLKTIQKATRPTPHVETEDTGQMFAMKVLQKSKIIGRNLMRYALTERNLLSYIRHPFIAAQLFWFCFADTSMVSVWSGC